jgi:hypothetical protein
VLKTPKCMKYPLGCKKLTCVLTRVRSVFHYAFEVYLLILRQESGNCGVTCVCAYQLC